MAKKGALLLGLACGTSGQNWPASLAPPVTIPSGLAPISWPAATPADSNRSWPGGFQPSRLVNWALDAAGRPTPCWKTTVLHDTAQGWPGQCLGLFQLETISTEKVCMAACWGDPRCAVWQMVNSTTPMQCWVGMDAKECDLRAGLNKQGTFQVKRSQRLQHGDVHVFKPSLAGMFVHNLYNFGTFAEGNQALSIQRCRDACYSSIVCQYWLFSTNTGCWADVPSESTQAGKTPNVQVSYPLTSSNVETGTAMAKSIIAGEFVTHYCPPPVLEKPAVDPFYHPKKESNLSWLAWLIGGILLALALCAIVFYYQIYLPNRKGSRSLINGRDRFNTEASNDDRDYMQNGHGPMNAPNFDESQMSMYTTPEQESFGPPAPPKPMNNFAFPQPARPASSPAKREMADGYQPVAARPSVQQMANMPTMVMPPGGQQSSLNVQRMSTPAPAMAMSYWPQPQQPMPYQGGGRLM